MQSLDLPVPDDYVPSAGELDNFMYLCGKYTVGWIMRECDKQIMLLQTVVGGEIIGNAGLSLLCENTCEFLWDHICGETDEFTPDQLFEHMKPIYKEWYENTTPEQRSDVE